MDLGPAKQSSFVLMKLDWRDVKSTQVGSESHQPCGSLQLLTPDPGEPLASSGLHGPRACTCCTDIHTDTNSYTLIFNVDLFKLPQERNTQVTLRSLQN